MGADVLAAAGGHVTVARDTHDLCGLIIVIEHDPDGYRNVPGEVLRKPRTKPWV